MNVTRLLLPCLLLITLLNSCGDKNYSSERDIVSETVKIKIMATSSKKFDAGITGAPHAPIIIPYAGFDKNWGITLMIAGMDTLMMEEFSGFEGKLGKKELADTLSKITITFSKDKKHLLYSRKSNSVNVKQIAHFFDNGKGFLSNDIPEFNADKLNWEVIPPTLTIAKKLISTNTGDYKFWDCVESLPRENELDFLVLEKMDSVASARYFMERRGYNWNERSEDWKKAVRKKFSSVFSTFQKENKRDEFIYYSVFGIIKKARDKDLDEIFVSYLLSQEGKQNTYTELTDIFNDSLRKENIPTLTKLAAKKCQSLLISTKAEDLSTAYNIAGLTGNAQLEKTASQKLLSFWPQDEVAVGFFQNEIPNIDSLQRKTLLTKAQNFITKKDSTPAIKLLEDYCDCVELRKLAEKYKGKIEVRFECQDKK